MVREPLHDQGQGPIRGGHEVSDPRYRTWALDPIEVGVKSRVKRMLTLVAQAPCHGSVSHCSAASRPGSTRGRPSLYPPANPKRCAPILHTPSCAPARYARRPFVGRRATGRPGQPATGPLSPFLNGFALDELSFEEWLLGERERPRSWRSGARPAPTHQRKAGALEAGVQTAIKILGLDPLQEPVHWILMRLLCRSRPAGSRVRQYRAGHEWWRRNAGNPSGPHACSEPAGVAGRDGVHDERPMA